MATKRKAISKKVRFEVFKRDSFSCQYCGAAAPEAILVIDHIHPVAKGGDNSVLNLITSCRACNAGKSDRTLDDNAHVQKQKRQLDELNERRAQLEMIVKWREGLRSVDEDALQTAVDAFEGWVEQQWELDDYGRKFLARAIKKHGLAKTLDAIDTSCERYLIADTKGWFDKRSANEALKKVGGILYNLSLPSKEREANYVRAILRNRVGRIREEDVKQAIIGASDEGVEFESLKNAAKQANCIDDFYDSLEDLIVSQHCCQPEAF
jgi:hypothetical protein